MGESENMQKMNVCVSIRVKGIYLFFMLPNSKNVWNVCS